MPPTKSNDIRQSLASRSQILRVLRWWTIRRCFMAFAWTITLLVLFCVCYLWFGQRSWEKYKHELAAQGESLNWSSFIPPTIPDEQNFAQTPLLAPLLDYRWDSTKGSFAWKDAEGYQRAASFARAFGWPFAEKTIRDLSLPTEKASGTNEAARLERKQFATHVLAVLKEYEPVLDELRSASTARPKSCFKIHYVEGPLALLPHLSVLDRVSQILRLRASAELELGQADPAFEDVKLILCLANSVRDEPFLPSQFTRRASLVFAIQRLHQALERHS